MSVLCEVKRFSLQEVCGNKSVAFSSSFKRVSVLGNSLYLYRIFPISEQDARNYHQFFFLVY